MEKQKDWKIVITDGETEIFKEISKDQAIDLVPAVVRGSIDRESLIFEMEESE